MKIQPILELKGIRIELTLAEAEKIVRRPATGGEQIQKEIKLLVDLHHSKDNAGDIIPAADPHTRIDGSKPSREAKKLAQKKPERPKPEREACDFCGGFYRKGRGITMHQLSCEAKAKIESESRSREERSVLDDFVPDET